MSDEQSAIAGEPSCTRRRMRNGRASRDTISEKVHISQRSEDAMHGQILDFDPDDGDRLVIEGYWSPERGYAAPRFVGETASLKFNDFGFSRDGEDVIFRYNNAYYGSDMLTVRLVNYSGSLNQSDIVFV